MLYPQHFQELQASAITPALAELNFYSTDDNWFIRQWLNWKPTQKWKACPFDSGWYCGTLDPRTSESRAWGPFKPDQPLLDSTRDKLRKYEHPAGCETQAIFLQPDRSAWEQIALRYRIPFTPLMFRLRDRAAQPHFWQWVWTYNVPIILCEGAKKAAALLSAGYVAIALPGVWNGRRKRQGNRPEHLIPDLQYFATPERTIYFCFDQDPKPKTRQQVSHALIRTGKLFATAGCRVHVIRLPGPEKGVDDFIVARGSFAFDELYADAIALADYEQTYRTEFRGYHLTYPIALDLNQRYLLPSALDHSALQLPDSGVIAIASDMGTGKTALLETLKQTHPQARILNLGHRVALLRNLSRRLQTAMYSNLGWGMWQEPCLSITADSLHKLKTEGNVYDFVFIDEVEQFIQHLLCSKTCKENRHLILQSLKYFIGSARCVVICDAHLSDIAIRFIEAMRADTEPPFVIRNRYRNGGRHCYWYEGRDRSGIVAALKQALYLGEKPIVACDSLEFSKDLYEMLRSLFPEKNLVCINSENSGEEWAKRLIEQVNVPGVLDQLDGLIYSPSINTGVSLDRDHFTVVFGIFIGGSLSGTDCLQALSRYRKLVHWHVWIGNKPIGGYRLTHAARLKQQKLNANDLCGFLLQIDAITGAKGVQDEFAWDAWAALEGRRNESLNNLRGHVKTLIEQQGNFLILAGETIDSQTHAELMLARNINRQVKRQGILNAVQISEPEARRLAMKEHPTLADWYKLERHRLESSWGREVDEALIDLDQEGRTASQFNQLAALLEPPAAIKTTNRKRIFYPAQSVTQRDWRDREQLHPLDWHNVSVTWSMRMELGLHQFLTPDREFRNDDPALVELATKAQRHARIIKEFLGLTIRQKATPMQILQQLLDQVGLKLVCHRREGRRGEQVRIYRLNPSRWALAMSFIGYQKTKQQTAQPSRVPAIPTVVATKGFFSMSLNKIGEVTTPPPTPPCSSEALKDGLDLMQQAIQLRDRETLRAVWQIWDPPERLQLLQQLPQSLYTQAMQLLHCPPQAVASPVERYAPNGAIFQQLMAAGTDPQAVDYYRIALLVALLSCYELSISDRIANVSCRGQISV